MAIKIGHSVMTENNDTGWNGRAKVGDQTGREVCISTWYDDNWDYVLRAKDANVAEKLAKNCEAGCKNEMIGYDQSRRFTLYEAASTVNHDLSKISTPCACDCSSFLCECTIASGIKVAYNLNTSTMQTAFVKTGEFELLTDKKYLTTDDYLIRGDILVEAGVHTVMALTSGAKAVASEEPGIDVSDIKVGDQICYGGNVYSNSGGGQEVMLKARIMYIHQILPSGAYPLLLSKEMGGEGFGYVSVTMLVEGACSPVYHTVNKGDTLGKIAKAYNTKTAILVELNSIKDANKILVGQKIRIR